MKNEYELVNAIKNGDDNLLAQLLRSSEIDKAQLNDTITNPAPTNYAIGHGMTLLQFASFRNWKEGNPAAVLVDHGAEIDLHSACGLGMTDRITEILTANPDAIHHQVDGYFPLQFAITASQASSVKCLTDHGDDPNRELRKVAYFGWENDIRDQQYTPWRPIHMATIWAFNAARIPVAEALAAAGADLNATSPLDGFHPIHLAAMPNRVDFIKFLVAQGVDIDSRTSDFNAFKLSNEEDGPISGKSGKACTALMVAAAEGFPESTACLLELGADPKAENDQGETAMDFASKRFWDGQPYQSVIDLLA